MYSWWKGMGMRRLEKLMEVEVNSGVTRHQKKEKQYSKMGWQWNEEYFFRHFQWKLYISSLEAIFVFVDSLNCLSLTSYYTIIFYIFICLYLHSPWLYSWCVLSQETIRLRVLQRFYKAVDVHFSSSTVCSSEGLYFVALF